MNNDASTGTPRGGGASSPESWCRPLRTSSSLSALRAAVLVLTVSSLTLVGCVSNRAVPEFRVYQSTFQETEVTVNAVLDEFEAVERELSIDAIRQTGRSPMDVAQEPPTLDDVKAHKRKIQENGGFDNTFSVQNSVYFATGTTPPITAAFRRSLRAVGAFNTVAEAYAEGRALDELETEFSGLLQAFDSLSQVLGVGSSVLGVAAPGAPLVTTGVTVVKGALEAGSKEAFRTAIIDVAPLIDETLVKMRDSAPQIFALLISKASNAAKDANAAGNITERDKYISVIEKYRTVMSNWVISIEATRTALADVVAAIVAPSTPSTLIDDLTATALEAASVTNQTKRLLGEIRAQP